MPDFLISAAASHVYHVDSGAFHYQLMNHMIERPALCCARITSDFILAHMDIINGLGWERFYFILGWIKLGGNLGF